MKQVMYFFKILIELLKNQNLSKLCINIIFTNFVFLNDSVKEKFENFLTKCTLST